MSNNIYNILGKLNSIINNTEASTPSTEPTVYESVEARGSITEAVKSLEDKYKNFKKLTESAKPNKAEFKTPIDYYQAMAYFYADVADKSSGRKREEADELSAKYQDKVDELYDLEDLDESAKPDFLDIDKDGDKKEPMKKAAADKGGEKKDGKKGMSDKQAKYFGKKEVAEGMDDLTDLDAYQFDEPDTDTAVAPSSAKQTAAERRRRLQDLEDRKAEKDNWFSGKDKESNVRIHKANYQDVSDIDEGFMDAVKSAGQKLNTAAGTAARKMGIDPANIGAKVDSGVASVRQTKANITKNPADVQKAKAASLKAADSRTFASGRSDPRVAGHRSDAISWDYRDDVKEVSDKTVGSLLQKRKDNEASANKGSDSSAAFDATGKRTDAYGASIARNKRLGRDAYEHPQANEGVEFKDAGKIKNSAPAMKKAKPAMVKESRVMEETDYFYEKVAKSLCNKNPNLDTSSSEFEMAVRKEMVAQGIDPNKARNILLMDEDFIMDVASSYGHYCKELAEGSAPMNSHLGGVSQELDELSKLAGLPVRETEVNYEEVESAMDEDAMGAAMGGIAGALVGKSPQAAVTGAKIGSALHDTVSEAHGVNVNGKEINVGSIEVEGVNSWDSPDFADAYITYAEFMDGTPLSDDELVQLEQEHGDLVNQAAHDSLQGSGDFLDEDDVAEGNEFSGALAAAKAKGEKEFEVDGKRYTVKEDINVNVTANGQEDALNLFRKLAGMPHVEPVIMTAQEEPCDGAMEVELDEEGERDIEYVNTPREQTAGIDAAIPSGNDLHATKRAYKIAQPGDNPMAVAEAKDTSWSKYTSILKDLLK